MYANKVLGTQLLALLLISSSKEPKEIWDSMITIAKDACKQTFLMHYQTQYKWEMTENKDIKVQINEYYKLLEDLKTENITLQEEFVVGLLIERLPYS